MDYRAEALAFAWALQWFDPPEDKPPLADHEAFRWMLIERTLLHTPDDQGIVTHADGVYRGRLGAVAPIPSRRGRPHGI